MDKGKHGFDGQKCAHASSKPLAIQAYALRAFPRLDPFLLRQNCVETETGPDLPLRQSMNQEAGGGKIHHGAPKLLEIV